MTSLADAAELDALADLAVELAQGAAEVVRAGRAGAFAVDAKSTATDLVTAVDRRAEQWLVDGITRRRPDDAILAEEGSGREGTSGVRWVLDPIDGTVNFVLGLPQYAVSVAVERDGVVVAGAVSNPATGETFHARLGGGAFLGSERLTGPRAVPLSHAVVATGFAYDAGVRARQIAVVAPLLPVVADIRRLGSAALDLCFVAAGRLDGYFEAGLNCWDYAAGALVASEAGCVVTVLGQPASSTRFVTASGAGLAAELHAALEALDAYAVRD